MISLTLGCLPGNLVAFDFEEFREDVIVVRKNCLRERIRVNVTSVEETPAEIGSNCNVAISFPAD